MLAVTASLSLFVDKVKVHRRTQLSTEEVKSLQKRERACEDLAKAVLDSLEVAASFGPETAQYVAVLTYSIQYQYQLDALNIDTLASFLCNIEGGLFVDAFVSVIKIETL